MTRLRFAAAAAGVLLMSVAGGIPASAATGAQHCDSIDIGVTKQFSAFVHHDASLFGSVSGRVAVGGNATLGSPMGWPGLSIGTGVDVDAGRGDLFVGGKVEAHGVVLEKGAAFVGGIVGAATGLAAKVAGAAVATVGIGGHLDVDKEFAGLTAKSAVWAGVKVNGGVQVDGDALVLSGTDAHQVVVGVSAAQLSAAKEIRIKVPAGAAVLVNVSGETYDAAAAGLRAVVVWDGHAYVKAGVKAGVVWNFAAAKKITLAGGVWPGTVLAPGADLNFGLGIGVGVTGGVIANSVSSMVAVDLGVFVGVQFCLPGGDGGTSGGGSATPTVPAASSTPSGAPAVPVSATPSVTPTPQPQAIPTEPLAYTGANVVWIAIAAIVLLAAGGTALVLARRRRVKP